MYSVVTSFANCCKARANQRLRDHLATRTKTNYNMLMEKEKYTQEEILLANNQLLSQINNKLYIIVSILITGFIISAILLLGTFFGLFSLSLFFK